MKANSPYLQHPRHVEVRVRRARLYVDPDGAAFKQRVARRVAEPAVDVDGPAVVVSICVSFRPANGF